MKLVLTDAEHAHLCQLQKQRRDDEGYVKVMVVLLLDAGWDAGQVAQALGLDDGRGYRYVQAWQRLGVEKYLLHEAPSYWDLAPSAGLAALSREVEQTLYADVRAVGAWLKRHWGGYSVSGLTQRLHRLGFSYKLTTPVPCEADPVRQAAFLAQQLRSLLAQAEAGRGRRLLCRRGSPYPPYALAPRVDPHRAAAAAAHRERAGTGEPARGGQRPLPQAGAPARDGLRERAKHKGIV